MPRSIKVGVVFKNGQIIPKWFNWEARQYMIHSLNYTWQDWEGKEAVMFFAVTSGANTYELAYYTSQMTWQLSKVA